MKVGLLACAFGRHSVDVANKRKAGGMHVGKCACCKTPMEEMSVLKSILSMDETLSRMTSPTYDINLLDGHICSWKSSKGDLKSIP